MLVGVLAVLASSILLMILGASDPKRVRTLRRSKSSGGLVLPTRVRRALGWLTLVPGGVLGVIGEWWAFVIWLGIIPAIGWTLAQVLARAADSSSPARH
jgi:hypothetical protein